MRRFKFIRWSCWINHIWKFCYFLECLFNFCFILIYYCLISMSIRSIFMFYTSRTSWNLFFLFLFNRRRHKFIIISKIIVVIGIINHHLYCLSLNNWKFFRLLQAYIIMILNSIHFSFFTWRSRMIFFALMFAFLWSLCSFLG